MKVEKNTETKASWWDWIFWVIIIILFFNFLFGSFDNSDRINDLEYKLKEACGQLDYLHNYISNLETELERTNSVSLYTFNKYREPFSAFGC